MFWIVNAVCFRNSLRRKRTTSRLMSIRSESLTRKLATRRVLTPSSLSRGGTGRVTGTSTTLRPRFLRHSMESSPDGGGGSYPSDERPQNRDARVALSRIRVSPAPAASACLYSSPARAGTPSASSATARLLRSRGSAGLLSERLFPTELGLTPVAATGHIHHCAVGRISRGGRDSWRLSPDG